MTNDEEGKNREARREQGGEEKPRVYAVQKDLTGWRFSRRDFLAAAGAAAAAVAVAGVTAGCGTATPEPVATPQPTLSPKEKAEACADVKAHKSTVPALAMSPDGALLASAGLDGTIKLWSLPEGEFVSCLMDPAANKLSVEGVTYRLESASGELLEYTLPCGSPIPAGAVCVCNCVAGGYVRPSAPSTHYWYPC